jgi:hypothetical protein
LVISIVEHLALGKLSDEMEREKLAKALSQRQINIGWLLNIVEAVQAGVVDMPERRRSQKHHQR